LRLAQKTRISKALVDLNASLQSVAGVCWDHSSDEEHHLHGSDALASPRRPPLPPTSPLAVSGSAAHSQNRNSRSRHGRRKDHGEGTSRAVSPQWNERGPDAHGAHLAAAATAAAVLRPSLSVAPEIVPSTRRSSRRRSSLPTLRGGEQPHASAPELSLLDPHGEHSFFGESSWKTTTSPRARHRTRSPRSRHQSRSHEKHSYAQAAESMPWM